MSSHRDKTPDRKQDAQQTPGDERDRQNSKQPQREQHKQQHDAVDHMVPVGGGVGRSVSTININIPQNILPAF